MPVPTPSPSASWRTAPYSRSIPRLPNFGETVYRDIIGESASAGLLFAGGVHLVKSAAVRPAVSVTTGGVANIPVSIAEEILATILSILAIVIPVAVAALIILLTAFVIWLLSRRARKSAEARGG